jgi:monoamine oxidase
MRDLAIERMVFAFGGDIRKCIVKCVTTHWSSDPWTRGGYSHCRPGKASVRAVLRETVGERLIFAGEHCSEHSYSTIHGAHESGVAAAEKAADLLS